ncbi:DNA cytosine methyltransferase [Pantoea septica]|uniref:DNA cytosine methyltransferase n=1 Tax=Pantoea septica TaxID=472695 RepID=UPI00289BB4D7|nr:DNA cytosine methyltransferase [Pantoea septica]
MTKKIDVYDFFSGCGGTSAGLKSVGMNIVFGLDVDFDSFNTFKKNYSSAHFINDDIKQVDVEEIRPLISKSQKNKSYTLFCGCAPCQPFSKQNKSRNKDDPRKDLLTEFSRFVSHYTPDFVLIENVPGIQNVDINNGNFQFFLERLTSLGYHFDYGVIRALWFGVPQTRERFVLLASKHTAICLPSKSHDGIETPFATVRDWIGSLPPISAGETHENILDHTAAKLSELNIRRIQATPEGKGRECWPEELILECHKKHKGHSDVYGRLAWDKPASGLTTKCISYSNGRFGHPEQDRAISIREAALLQTFPYDYLFTGSMISKAKQIGNAVPPKMSEALGQAILSSL